MNIRELIEGKNDKEELKIEGASVPVSALKRLWDEGYENIIIYQDNKVLSAWGKNCAASFTEEQLRQRV